MACGTPARDDDQQRHQSVAASVAGRRSYEKIAQSKIFWNEDGPDNRKYGRHRRPRLPRTDLRPDFKNNEQTAQGVVFSLGPHDGRTGNKPLALGDNWLENREIY